MKRVEREGPVFVSFCERDRFQDGSLLFSHSKFSDLFVNSIEDRSRAG